jgi:hypothetical protein
MKQRRGQYGLSIDVRGKPKSAGRHSGSDGSKLSDVRHITTAPKSAVSDISVTANIPSWRLKAEAEKRRAAEAEIVTLKAELQASQARVKELERTFITRKRTLSLASC